VRDIKRPLRIGYISALNGLTVSGKAIKTYDKIAPHGVSAPYIIIDSIVPISNNTKDGFFADVTVDLLIYSTNQGDFGGSEDTDLIVDAVLGIVIPQPGKSGVSAAGFNVYMAKQVGSNDEFEVTNSKRVYYTRLTIEHSVQQLING
jgi:hypothetical protein